MTFIQTYTGKYFDYEKLSVDAICIEDIAHALSMLCRFGGHTKKFYSVAEHSVHTTQHVPEKDKLWALLHDATEAYMVDLPSPLKKGLSEYKTLEERILNVIAEKFNLDGNCPPPIVKEMDTRLLLTESKKLFKGGIKKEEWNFPAGINPLSQKIKCWEPKKAEKKFLKLFKSLTRN